MRLRLMIPLLCAVAAPDAALADRRYYGETYDATIAPPGGLDIELWTTFHQAPKAGGTPYWLHQIELETGITSHWDVALYNNFVYEQGGPTQYQGLQLETRYRLSEPGAWVVDPVLYLELRKEFIADKPWAVEQRLILGKDLGPLNVSVNGLAEQEFPSGGGTELEWSYAVGASWELHPIVRVGGETYAFWNRGAGESAYVYTAYAGPALSLAAWRTWLVLAYDWGLNASSDRFRARAVFSFQL